MQKFLLTLLFEYMSECGCWWCCIAFITRLTTPLTLIRTFYSSPFIILYQLKHVTCYPTDPICMPRYVYVARCNIQMTITMKTTEAFRVCVCFCLHFYEHSCVYIFFYHIAWYINMLYMYFRIDLNQILPCQLSECSYPIKTIRKQYTVCWYTSIVYFIPWNKIKNSITCSLLILESWLWKRL